MPNYGDFTYWENRYLLQQDCTFDWLEDFDSLRNTLDEIFSDKYNKPIQIIGIKPGEKLLESLINESQSARIKIIGDYTHIKSIFNFNETIDETKLADYNSKINPLNKSELLQYLIELDLLYP